MNWAQLAGLSVPLVTLIAAAAVAFHRLGVVETNQREEKASRERQGERIQRLETKIELLEQRPHVRRSTKAPE